MELKKYSPEIQRLIHETKENRNARKRGYLKSCKQLLNFAKDTNDEELLGFAYFYLGRSYYYMPDRTKQAMKTIKKSMFYAQKTNDYAILARIYNILGIDASNRGLEELALEYYMLSRRYSVQSEDYELRYIVEYNMGYTYLEMGDLEESLRFFMKAYRLSKKNKNNTSYYVRYLICCVVGILYMHQKKEDRVEKVFHELELIERQYGEKIPEAFDEPLNFIFRINYYDMIGETEMSDEMQQAFLKQLSADSLPVDSISDLVRYCETLVVAGKLELAHQYIHILKPIIESAEVPHISLDFYRMMVAYAEKKQDEAAKVCAINSYYAYSQKQVMERKKAFTFYSEMIETVENIRLENIRLAKEARTDSLTKLPNRLEMMEVAEAWFERARDAGVSYGVEIFDIDKFKDYNDTFGHQIGDRCLEEIGKVLKTFVQDDMFFARYGGDEFLACYYDMTDDEILEKAKDIRDALKKICIKTGGKDICGISVSQGIRNTVPGQDNKMWDYMYSADSALYEVKKRKRGDILIIHKAFLSDASLQDAVTVD